MYCRNLWYLTNGHKRDNAVVLRRNKFTLIETESSELFCSIKYYKITECVNIREESAKDYFNALIKT